MNSETVHAMVLRDEIYRILAGQDPKTQSAVIADLLATWLAGHVVRGDRLKTDRLRADLLRDHINAVRVLVNINAQEMGTDE